MSLWRGGGGTGRFPHARQEEGGLTWGKHGFPHGSESKTSDGHVSEASARGSRPLRPRLDDLDQTRASTPCAWTSLARRVSTSGSVSGSTPCPRLKMLPGRPP